MTPARTSVRAGGVLLFNAVVVVPGDHEDTGNGDTGDDKGDHIWLPSFGLGLPSVGHTELRRFLSPGVNRAWESQSWGCRAALHRGRLPEAALTKNEAQNILRRLIVNRRLIGLSLKCAVPLLSHVGHQQLEPHVTFRWRSRSPCTIPLLDDSRRSAPDRNAMTQPSVRVWPPSVLIQSGSASRSDWRSGSSRAFFRNVLSNAIARTTRAFASARSPSRQE